MIIQLGFGARMDEIKILSIQKLFKIWMNRETQTNAENNYRAPQN